MPDEGIKKDRVQNGREKALADESTIKEGKNGPGIMEPWPMDHEEECNVLQIESRKKHQRPVGPNWKIEDVA